MLRKNIETVHPALLSSPSIREVEMEVVFGTPSKNCSGAGICMIAGRFPQGYTIACPHAPAIIHCAPGQEQELVFRFRKNRLCGRAAQAYFTAGYFLVEESFSLPQRLIRQWGLPVDKIPPGRYLLEEYSREWRLYFSLQSEKPL